ncbi:uncharacterized protein METZ01_LOCUS207268 [marine metagenome]|uniref:Uncharacterized protein n=1 Tax=marine metagenome TaxID=408172 RepID=A0A382EWB9_9ZZZZ
MQIIGRLHGPIEVAADKSLGIKMKTMLK